MSKARYLQRDERSIVVVPTEIFPVPDLEIQSAWQVRISTCDRENRKGANYLLVGSC